MRGRLARNSTVRVCANGTQTLSWAVRAAGCIRGSCRLPSSRLRSTVSSSADVPALISEEWTSFSSKKPGNRSRSKSAVISAIARFEGRFFPSR